MILIVSALPGPPSLQGKLRAALQETGFVYTLPYALDWSLELADLVHGAGSRLAMDVESSAPLQGAALRSVLKTCDLVFCSLGGLRLASGEADLERGAAILASVGVETLVVTLGGKGARVYTREGCQAAPGYQVPAVDTTGAGDCFHAAFLSGLVNGWDHVRCLRFANAAAALSVQKIGPREGLPTRMEVEQFLAAVGEEY
jgi:sugar/nucleoside kinase (ribokinase family)